jgi:uncharacterized membrane protein YdfJ with MMPL/SSD domain
VLDLHLPLPQEGRLTMPRWLIYLIAILVVLGILILVAEHIAFHVH